MTEMTREQAQAALDAALKNQSAARARLALAVAAVATEKANVMEADGTVLMLRGILARLGGPIKPASANKGTAQSDLCAAVVSVLAAAGAPMTNEAIFAALQNEGVEMAGDKPRSNLSAYIARWAKVPGADIVSAGRGRWTVNQAEKPVEVPSFLAPADSMGNTNTTSVPEVPPFLTTAEPVPQDSDDAEEQAVDAPAVVTFPLDFPGRDALEEAGYTNIEQLAGKTHDQLRRIKGVGAQTARDILAALEG
jgi:hypothetical protein